ncbi:MAG: HAD family hydrolase [Spirochaetaceae bacterium]
MQNITASRDELIDLIRRTAAPMEPLESSVPERLQPLPGVRAVLFDIYGTLLISSSGDIGAARMHARRGAFQHALEETFGGSRGAFGDERALTEPEAAAALAEKIYFEAIEEMHADKHSAGLAHPEVDIREVWSRVIAELGMRGKPALPDVTDAEIEEVAVRFEGLTNPTWPMPEMESTVRAIATEVPVGIVSNAQFFTPLLFPALVGATLDELGVRPDLCAYSYLAGEAKPSPALFEPVVATLRRDYGIAADEVLYVGNDMLNDIWSAGESGLKSCLFAGDERSLRLRGNEPVAAATTPSCVVRSLPAVASILGIGGRA